MGRDVMCTPVSHAYLHPHPQLLSVVKYHAVYLLFPYKQIWLHAAFHGHTLHGPTTIVSGSDIR